MWDEHAEEAVLGAMMLHNRAILDVADTGLQPGHFYRPSHGLICKAIYALDTHGRQADAISVVNFLRQKGSLNDAGGQPKVLTLPQIVSTTASATAHAEIVVEMAATRRLKQAAIEIGEIADGTGTAIEKMAAADAAVAEAIEETESKDLADIGEQMNDEIASISEAFKTKKPRTGLRTGFTEIDKLTHGMRPGQLWVIAARPGMGKSTLAQNILEFVAGGGKHGALFSLEMGAEEIGLRMISSLSGVAHDHLLTAQLTADEHAKMLVAKEALDKLPIIVADGSIVTIQQMRAKARRMQRTKGLAVIVVDYIQLMVSSTKVESRQNEVAAISRGLKMLARELSVPVIALSQLNRTVESRENKRPNLADLRDSGAIEQDADVVAFLYRDDYYNPTSTEVGVTEVNFAKQRSGATGMVKLQFVSKRSKFSNSGRGKVEATEEVF